MSDPFTSAKRAQQKLDTLEAKRQAIRAELEPEALALLDALDEHRARQPIDVEPSSPDPAT